MRVFAGLLLHPCEYSLQAAEPIVPLELPHLCTSFREHSVFLYFCISAFADFCILCFCVSIQAAQPVVPYLLPHLCNSFRKLLYLCISAFLYFCISAFLYFCSFFSKIIFAIAYFFISVLLYFSPSRWTYCPSLDSAPLYLLLEHFFISTFFHFFLSAFL